MKNNYKPKLFFALIIIIGSFIFLSIEQFYNTKENEEKQQGVFDDNQNEKDTLVDLFITANPFDLTQIAFISKFRSCAGHDYRGQGSKNIEPISSMKHYIKATADIKNRQLKLYAPFNGQIIDIFTEQSGNDYQIVLLPDDNPTQEFRFFHVQKNDLVIGKHFKAGDLLTYASGNGTDIAIYGTGHNAVTDSFFNYMNNTVYAEYTTVGLTKGQAVISLKDRLANPCVCIDPKIPDCIFEGYNEDDWINIK